MKSINPALALSLTFLAMTIIGLIAAVFIQAQTNQNLSDRVESLESELKHSESRIVQLMDENDKELKAAKSDVKFFKDLCDKYYHTNADILKHNAKLLDDRGKWIEARQRHFFQ